MSLSQSKWELLSPKGRTIRKPMGGRGGRAKYKKIFAQGKVKRKIIHERQLTLKNIHAVA